MAQKPKPKKQGLSDSVILRTIDTIRQVLPNKDITIADIRNPTRDMVISFFTECVNNLEEKTSFISGLPIPNNCPAELSEEELLYVKLSRIDQLKTAGFKLGDLYKFDPKRVNYHFFITAHFLLFTESIMDKVKQTANKVKEAEESLVSSKQRLDDLKEEKYQLRIALTNAKQRNNTVKEQAKKIAPLYQQTLDVIESNEQKCKQLRLELEKLTLQHEELQKDINKHKKSEADLKGLVVTEEEYNKLKEDLDALLKTDQNLEEIDMNYGLLEQKQLIKDLHFCLKELETFVTLPKQLSGLVKLRFKKSELERSEQTLQKLQQTILELERKITQTQEELLKFKNGNKEFEMKLTKATENLMMDEVTLKQEFQQQYQLKVVEIEQLKESVGNYERNLINLENGIKDRCNALLNKQAEVMDLFKDFMNEIKAIKFKGPDCLS